MSAPLRSLLRNISTPQPVLVFIVLAIFTVLIHAPALTGEFIYDDHLQVEKNQSLTSLGNIAEYFKHSTGYYSRSPASYYRPMHMVAYSLIYRIAGTRSWGYHLANLILALAVSWMVFQLARFWLPNGPAGLAALLFAVHPLHVEAVAWIAALPELLCALLILMVMRLHLKATWSLRDYIWGGLGLLTATLTRENALVLPLLALFYDYLTPHRKTQFAPNRIWLRYVIYLSIIGLYLILRTQALGYLLTNPGVQYPLSGWVWFLNLVQVLALDLWYMVFPPGYSGFHVFHPVQQFWEARSLTAFGLLALFAGAGVAIYMKTRRWLFFYFWIVITLLPFLYFPALGDNLVVERYLFLPSLGVCVLLAAALASLWPLARPRLVRWAAGGLSILLVLGWASMSWSRAGHWQSDLTFYGQSLKQDPDAYHFYLQLAYAHYQRGEKDRAWELFNSLGRWYPGQRPPTGTVSADMVLALPVRYRSYRRAYFDAKIKAAAFLFQEGDYAQAIGRYLELSGLFPDNPQHVYYLGLCYEKTEQWQQARAAYQQVLRLDPNHAQARQRLANERTPEEQKSDALCEEARLLAEQKKYLAAIRLLNRAIRLAPDSARPHHYLFNIYWITGEKKQARTAIGRALQLEPENPLYQHNYRSLDNP